MQHTSESVETLVEQFATLPTIGRKTARRLAAFVLKMPREEVEALAEALVGVKDQVRRCARCYTVTDGELCAICASPQRDHSTICVVEEPGDVQAIESTGEYRGLYHVLGGAISPLDGVGPEDLRIRELACRIDPDFGKTAAGDGAVQEAAPAYAQDAPSASDEEPSEKQPEETPEPVDEIILAVNPNVEGDTTAYYLAQLLEPLGARVTRIARGLPIGGDLEYADEATLARALEGRGGV